MYFSETIDGEDKELDSNSLVEITTLTKMILIAPKIILTQIHSMKTTTFVHNTISAMAQYINIGVNRFLCAIHNYHHSKSGGCACLSSCLWAHFKWKLDYNARDIGMVVVVQVDKTGIISQTNILGIKREAFLCFNLTE